MSQVKYRISVTGLVQGIGFRPFVAELAEELHLAGQVKNLGGYVEIIVSGETEAVERFLDRLVNLNKTRELPGCRIDEVEKKELGTETYKKLFSGEKRNSEKREDIDSGNAKKVEFEIVDSSNSRETRRFLPVDMATCDRCISEMQDKNNRRYRYPFISCTACGPRFSIQKKVPYDRDTITMDDFIMCEACRAEYTEKGNIRRHAQTIACKDCGPKLIYVKKNKENSELSCDVACNESSQDFDVKITDQQQAILEAISDLKAGKIGAIKDIGGYHFACSPFLSVSAKALREFKNRDKKPFAVMFPNIESVEAYCEVSPKERELLLSNARPIVLLHKKKSGDGKIGKVDCVKDTKKFAYEVCGESDRIGALLPCNPLQILLLEACGPLVMTSGNRGGEPILISEKDMEVYLGEGIDFMLTHDREILTPLDDSIYQVVEENPQLIRRARGLVPEPIFLERNLEKDSFAAGGDLKAVFALGRDNMVYLSQYFGDLEDVRCMESRKKGISHMKELLDIAPEVGICDMHPGYYSVQEMEDSGDVQKIQHHHAHVASVIAEHGLRGKVLGIACDGTGFGTDGTIWGSEFLLCEEEKMQRVGHFSTVKLVGGDASAKQADVTLHSYMLQAREDGVEVEAYFKDLESADITKESEICEAERVSVEKGKAQKFMLQELAWKQNINTAYSSSMGRLFDAAAALLDICHYNSYEGECAILLEQAAHRGKAAFMTELETLGKDPHHDKLKLETGNLSGLVKISVEQKKELLVADSKQLLADLYSLKTQYSKEILAYLFHHAVAEAIVDMAEAICKETETKQVALSGGTFINRILFTEVKHGLEEKGISVYSNEKVPCGDGGIALGQIYLGTF